MLVHLTLTCCLSLFPLLQYLVAFNCRSIWLLNKTCEQKVPKATAWNYVTLVILLNIFCVNFGRVHSIDSWTSGQLQHWKLFFFLVSLELLRVCVSTVDCICRAAHLTFDYLVCEAAICQLIANGKYQISDVYLPLCLYVCVCACMWMRHLLAALPEA